MQIFVHLHMSEKFCLEMSEGEKRSELQTTVELQDQIDIYIYIFFSEIFKNSELVFITIISDLEVMHNHDVATVAFCNSDTLVQQHKTSLLIRVKYSSAYTAYCSAFQYKTENVISYQHIDGLYDVDEDLVLLVFDSF